jgi:hypothetical protein
MKCPSCGKSLWFVRAFCPFCKIPIVAPLRPKSVTVISWMALVIGGIALLAIMSPNAQRNFAEYRSQHTFLYVWFCAGPVVAVICGAFMLRGVNWARWLLVLWFGYNVIGNVVRSPLKLLIPSLAGGSVFVVAVCLLFRPAATAFFCGRASEVRKDPPTLEPPKS